MENKDMPAMPCDDIVIRDKNGNLQGAPISCAGLTKLEHFAGLAPPMPSWFEAKFVSNPSLNGGIDCMNFNETESWITEEAEELMFMVWPVHYAKALLKQLEDDSNE